MTAPFGTTANPDWFNAEKSVDLVPILRKKDADADLYTRLAGNFLLTQGDVFEKRLSDVWLDWQKQFIRSSFQAQSSLIVMGKGPLALDTPIATPDGWSTMGDMKVGDQVFAVDGKPTKVTAVSPTFINRKCYRLTFSDGTEIVADEDHRWVTTPRQPWGSAPPPMGVLSCGKPGEPIKCTTGYIAQTLGDGHRIDMSPKTASKSVMITGCEPIDSVPVKCITIDHPSHLFLAGEGMIPTHNSGKSTTVAAMAIAMVMYCRAKNIHHRGLVAILAPTIPAARIVFDHVQECVLADDDLRDQFKSNVQSRSLVHESTGITIQILACDMSAAVGRRPILLICDELHEIGTISGGEKVVDQLERGGRNFGTAFKTIMISTMSVGQPQGVFKKRLDYARKVRDGEIDDPTFLPVLFEFPIEQRPDLSIDDPEQWWRGMPSLTTPKQRGTMDIAMMRAEVERAATSGDKDEFRLMLSQRLGVQADDLAAAAESPLHAHWPRAPLHSVDGFSDARAVTIGVDVGGTDDPAAACLLRKYDGGEYHAEVRQWLVQSGYDRATQNTQDVYDEAIEDGSLTLVADASDIDAEIGRWAAQVYSVYPSLVFGGDEHGRVGAKATLEHFAGIPFVPVSQSSVTIGSALAALEAILADMKMSRAPSALLDFNVKNAAIVETQSGLRRIGKRDGGASGQGAMKVDGLAAILDAVYLTSQAEALALPDDLGYWVA
jgi:phage terminase large subunit-like protein